MLQTSRQKRRHLQLQLSTKELFGDLSLGKAGLSSALDPVTGNIFFSSTTIRALRLLMPQRVRQGNMALTDYTGISAGSVWWTISLLDPAGTCQCMALTPVCGWLIIESCSVSDHRRVRTTPPF